MIERRHEHGAAFATAWRDYTAVQWADERSGYRKLCELRSGRGDGDVLGTVLVCRAEGVDLGLWGTTLMTDETQVLAEILREAADIMRTGEVPN